MNISIPFHIEKGNPMKFLHNGKWETFLVLSPQCPFEYGMWPTTYVDAMLDYAEKNLRIDKNRIYMMGVSMGGGGTWKYITESVDNAKKYAAVATVCAPPFMTDHCNIAAAKLPLWAFHAVDDQTVPISSLYDAIDGVNACNPAIPAIKTVYETGGHTVWDTAFDTEHSYQNPNVFEWLLDHTRAVGNQAPIATINTKTLITLPESSIVLNGWNSKDEDGTVASYLWTKISGPALRMKKINAGQTLVDKMVRGTYRFRLTVKDNKGASGSAEATIVVNALPVVKAGPDITVNWPNTFAFLNGSNSTDRNDWVAQYKWTKLSGPNLVISTPNTNKARLYNLKPGVYKLRLTATDSKGGRSSDDVVVTVKGKQESASGGNTMGMGDITTLSSTEQATLLQTSLLTSGYNQKLYPNPALNNISISCNLPAAGNTTIVIYDLSGKQVRILAFEKGNEPVNRNIDISSLVKGVYLMDLKINNVRMSSGRFVKQ